MREATLNVIDDTVRAERKRRESFLYFFSAFLIILQTSYAVYDYTSEAFLIDSVLEATSSAILIVNLFAYWRHRNLGVAFSTVAVTVMALVLLVFPKGGIEGTSIFWVLVFPAMSFLFGGLRRGLFFNALFIFGLSVMVAAQRFGYFQTMYSSVQLGQMFVVLVAVMLLAIASELVQERFRNTIVAQRERLRVLLENLPVGVVMVDAKDGLPTAANASAERLLGRPIDSTVAAADFFKEYCLVNENGAPCLSEQMPLAAALAHGDETTKSDVFVKRPDGTTTILRIVGAPIKDKSGKVSAAVAVFEDMTKDHEIDQMKTEFVSLASHQLKTPLTSIKWAVESLLGGDFGKLSTEQRQSVSEIESVTNRLMRLVSDLLSVSRIETGKKFNLVRKATDVVPVLASILADFAPIATQRKVVLSSPTLPASLMLDVDGDKFREVFSNLVGNAVKFSKDGGRVEVGTEEVDGVSQLFVKDDGLGIPKDEQSKVFGRFFRASNTAVEIEGTGLGLYIVKAIVEKHGGRVWFDSEEGRGTTFHVVLPPAKPA